MKTCRVLITTECNLRCSYCCNKIPEVQSRIKMTTFDQIVESNYDIFNITGGEPLADISKLYRVLCGIIENDPSKKIYLYSNGTLLCDGIFAEKNYSLLNWICHNIDGINIGVHERNKNIDFSIITKMFLTPDMVRFHVEDNAPWRNNIESRAKTLGAQTKIWTRNECDTNEDIFII